MDKSDRFINIKNIRKNNNTHTVPASAESGWPGLVAISTQNCGRNMESKTTCSTVYSSFVWVSDSFWPVYWSYSSQCLIQRVGFSLLWKSKAAGRLEPQPKHKHSIYLTDRSLTVFWPALPCFVKKNCNRGRFLHFSVSNWQNSIDRYSHID